jgi:hypothetical protein
MAAPITQEVSPMPMPAAEIEALIAPPFPTPT